MTSEVVNVVRTAIAGVAATLAKVVFATDDGWEEIFGILVQLLEKFFRLIGVRLLRVVVSGIHRNNGKAQQPRRQQSPKVNSFHEFGS